MSNNAAYVGFVGDALDTRLAEGRLPTLERLDAEIETFELEEDSVDFALMVMSWHDLYWVSDGWPAVDADDFARRVQAALKPGGVLLIIDHSAETGTGVDSVDQLHRIEEAHVYRTLTDLGFELTGQSQVLRSAGDDRRVGVFDEAIRGKTDRFVLAFTAP